MKKSLQFGLALALLATPALADKFRGQYKVQFFGPHHQSGGSVCYEFKPKGQTVPGFPNSGTWDQVDGIAGGDFLVQGRDLHFFGSFDEGDGDLISFSFHVSLNTGKGDFDSWIGNKSPIVPTDDGTIIFTAGC